MKTLFDTLPPELQKRHSEFNRMVLNKAIVKQEGEPVMTGDGGATWYNPKDDGVLWQNPSLTTAIGSLSNSSAIGSVSTTSNAPIRWNLESRHATWSKCQGKVVVDIGVTANGACVTFDDSSMLEINPSSSFTNLIDRTSLNLLNGTQLDDIVVIPQHSLVSDWIGNLVIFGRNGAQVVFKIISPEPSQNFYFELKDLNAIRKQTTPI
jgi:hypothetical protein